MNRRRALQSILGGAALGIPALFGTRLTFADVSPKDELEASERKAMAGVAEEFMRKFEVPGLSVAIAREGVFAYQNAFGFTGRDSREALSTSNLFRIASISKPITSATIFSLIEKGQLRQEDKVFGTGSVLGTKYGRQPYAAGIEQITIDHLLTHAAGGWDNGPDDPMFSNLGMNHAELISWTLDHQPLKNPPAKVHAYSNFGYCILGRVIEKITGQPYADCVQKAILSPCGISDMRIGRNKLKDRAAGEVTYYEQTGKDPYEMNVTRMDSHGGWIATPSDLVRFATHVDGFDTSRNILKPETIRKMTEPEPLNSGYARGWRVNQQGHWWHGGDLPGTNGVLVRTSSHFCWAALANTYREAGGDMGEALDDMVWEMASKVNGWRKALGLNSAS